MKFGPFPVNPVMILGEDFGMATGSIFGIENIDDLKGIGAV